jgi:hypothetical protein
LVDQFSRVFWQIFGIILVDHLGFGKGIFSGRRFLAVGHSSLRSLRFLAGLGIFGTWGFLAGFKEFFPPLSILVGMAENEQSTKKVGNDIL